MVLSTTPTPTVLSFGRYVGTSPLRRAAYVDSLRRQRTGRGYNPYSKMGAAIRADLRFGRHGENVSAAVTDIGPRWRRAYGEVAGGWRQIEARLPPDVRGERLPRSAVVVVGQLPITVNPHLQLTDRNGITQIGYLWFAAEPPSQEVAECILRLLQRAVPEIKPGAEAAFYDVRRNIVRRTADVPAPEMDRILAGEAAGFTLNWRLAA